MDDVILFHRMCRLWIQCEQVCESIIRFYFTECAGCGSSVNRCKSIIRFYFIDCAGCGPSVNRCKSIIRFYFKIVQVVDPV